jgi:hypothetical protein
VNIIKLAVRTVLASGVGCCCLMSTSPAVAADASPAIPPVIEAGFAAWGKVSDPNVAFSFWKKGGLMENDAKVAALANYFRRIERAVGNYKSYEPVESKQISRNSRITYLAINFERGAVYARFLIYRTDNNWVVQNMDFSTQPEALMPWLAFAGGDYGGQ